MKKEKGSIRSQSHEQCKDKQFSSNPQRIDEILRNMASSDNPFAYTIRKCPSVQNQILKSVNTNEV